MCGGVGGVGPGIIRAADSYGIGRNNGKIQPAVPVPELREHGRVPRVYGAGGNGSAVGAEITLHRVFGHVQVLGSAAHNPGTKFMVGQVGGV